MKFTINSLIVIYLLTSIQLFAGDFGAYYTKLPYEDEITGKYADVIVKLPNEGQIVFSREFSYLPYWKTDNGKWYFQEIIPRKGDGTKIRPDKYNKYSYVRIIENSPERIIVHWRYMPDFSDLDFDGVVHEIFTITPDGTVIRSIRQGRKKLDVYNDPKNISIQKLKLLPKGIQQLSYMAAKPPEKINYPPIDGSSVKSHHIDESPVAWWKFDEGLKSHTDKTKESVSSIACSIGGNKSVWKKGLSGTALAFEGYYSKVILPGAKAPIFNDGFTVEAWCALAVYPFSWSPIVHQCEWKKKGYYFGINEFGFPALMLSINGKWQEIVASQRIPLNQWTALAATYDGKQGKVCIYINGKLTKEQKVNKGKITLSSTDLQIGLNQMKLEASSYPTIIGIEGLLDEILMYDVPLNAKQIAKSYASLRPDSYLRNHPDLQPRILPGHPGIADKFGAFYTKLEYHELWDNMWRTSDYPDIVVKFDALPTSVVFWRGTNYGPAFVTENNIWMVDQSIETGYEGYGCCEHMSDKQCRFSHVRLIENTDARVVVHWRYAFVSTNQLKFPDEFPPTNERWEKYKSWGDEYYTIYPDGVIVRKVNNRSGASILWQDIQFLSPPGKIPEDQIHLKALTLADMKLWGHVRCDTLVLDWTNGRPKNTLEDANFELINFKSQYKIFLLFPEGVYIEPWIAAPEGSFTHFSHWNHWPVAQIPSDGRTALFPDRVMHSALAAADNAVFHGNMAIYGFTNQSIKTLLPLAKSWNYPPPIKSVNGGINKGYDKSQRAYILHINSDKMSFDLVGSKLRPVYHPCFVIKNWKNDQIATLEINGKIQNNNPDFRQGIIWDTDGTRTLIIWLKLESQDALHISIDKFKK